MKHDTGIYQIVNLINGKRYVGSALKLYSRKHGHFSILKTNKHHCRHLQHAYIKHGENNFKFEVILYCDKENLIFYEQRAIDTYKKINLLYNVCLIAGSNLGLKHTKRSKSNMSKAHKGKKLTQEHKNKIGAASKMMSKETKIKISEAHKGFKSYLYGKNGSKHHMSKAVYRINKKTDQIIDSFGSTREAAIKINIQCSHISEACNKKRKTAGGFKWEFVSKKENNNG